MSRPGEATAVPLSAAAFHQIVRSRRSIRTYRPDPISADVLERLFTSAAAAPSAHNRQPWRYLVIADVQRKVALARAMGQRLADDRRRDGDAEDAIARDVARSFGRITGAPVMILVCLTLEHADAYPDATRSHAEFLMAVQSTAMATQNLLLGAHAEGLGACWMCAPLFCPDVVRAALDIPAHWQPQGLITLGRPADGGRERPRRPMGEFVRTLSSPSPLVGEGRGGGSGGCGADVPHTPTPTPDPSPQGGGEKGTPGDFGRA
jgi:coenzyme F420-0:L-glutamate ligase/coenzyme F420-1:gamma-L-glutamate ligase